MPAKKGRVTRKVTPKIKPELEQVEPVSASETSSTPSSVIEPESTKVVETSTASTTPAPITPEVDLKPIGEVSAAPISAPVATEVPATAADNLNVSEAEVVNDLDGSDRKWLWIILALLVGMIIGGGGVYLAMGTGKGKAEKAQVVSPTPTVAVTPSPTEAVKLERKNLKLQVLNGSGVAGAAKSAKEYLEGLGYVDVAAGNAETEDNVETQISIKTDKKTYTQLLTDDLKSKYYLSAEIKDLADSSYDVVIVIGKAK